MKKFYISMDVDYVPGTQIAVDPVVRYCEKKALHCSFFVTGKFAEEYPEETSQIVSQGHDIGTHGWDHGYQESGENLRVDTKEEQLRRLRMARDAIHAATGVVPILNRNPNLWVSEATFEALRELGFRLDSSVPAGRLIGRIRSMKYLMAPLRAYRPSERSLARKGESSILEAPPSAFGIPINLSALRTFGLARLKWIVRAYAPFSEYLLFYGHPAEYLRPDQVDFGPNPVKRHATNIGPHIFDLTTEFLDFAFTLGYEPGTLSDLVR